MATDQLKYTNKLTGKNVLVIGGTSGIGYAVAEAALEYGAAKVVVSSSNPKRVEEALANLKKSYPAASSKTQLVGKAVDLGNGDVLEASIKELLEFATDNGSNKLDHVAYTSGDPLAVCPSLTI